MVIASRNGLGEPVSRISSSLPALSQNASTAGAPFVDCGREILVVAGE
jgi:hypothetical protein